MTEPDPFAELRLHFSSLREAKGWTQYDLAEAMSVPQSQVSDLETGRSGEPKFSTLRRWGSALGVQVSFAVQITQPQVLTFSVA